MTPEFIFFDLGNVLLTFSHERAARQMAEVAGVSTEVVHKCVFESGLGARYETGEVGDRQFYEEFCAATGTRPDYDRLEWAGAAIFDVNYPIMPVVAHLEAAGHRLGILSNTSPSHWRYAAGGRYPIVSQPFELAVLSFEVGAMKPDPKIYQHAADRAGVAPERIFFTDDRPENVEGALAAGWDAVQFTGAHELGRELAQRGVRSNY